MSKEVKKRKKRFWAFCLAMLLLLCDAAPIKASAAEYESDYNQKFVQAGTLIYPGDVFRAKAGQSYNFLRITYIGSSDYVDIPQAECHTVKTYQQITNSENQDFVCWKVKEVLGSADYFDRIVLQPVMKGKIIYNLDGGTVTVDSTDHTDTYTEYFTSNTTKELSGAPVPTKAGWKFTGWYSDASYTTQKTTIDIQLDETKHLYAKYTQEFNINYSAKDFAGESYTSPTTNPTSYTLGEENVILSSATKTGWKFLGWYDVTSEEANSGTEVPNQTIPTTWQKNLLLKPKFSNEYSIQYMEGTTQILAANMSAGYPENHYYGYDTSLTGISANKEYYTFDGWYDNPNFTGNKIISISGDTASNVILYAKFTPKNYTITYELNGGTNGEGNPANYSYGTQEIVLNGASKTGHTFQGWYTTSDFQNGTEKEYISSTDNENVNLYAKFIPSTYNISYDTEHKGTNPAENPTQFTYGQGIAAGSIKDAVAGTGYTFDGWYDNLNFTGNKVASISGDTANDVILYAKFKPKTYTITYYLNGGANHAENPTSYIYGTQAFDLYAASKTGHAFDGWYTTPDFQNGTKKYYFSSTDNADVNLYAKYEPTTYSIFYDTVGKGTNPVENPVTFIYGQGIAEGSIKDAIAGTGYTFQGWYANADFTGNKVTSISGDKTENVMLYAKFEPNTYTITYYNVDATSLNPNTNPTEYTYGTGVAQFYDCQKEGYTFGGWYTLSNYAENAKVTSISPTTVGNYSLYAKFTPQSRTITYVLDGGTNSSENPSSYTIGTGVSELKSATKLGYTFNGWYSDSSFTMEVTGISGTQMENVTLYAKFTANRYQITYELNDGTNASTNPTAYVYGTGVSSFASATKSGYTFNGWYSDASFTNRVTSIPADRTGNVVLYARFTRRSSSSMGGGSTGTITEVTYEIEYKLDGGNNAAVNPEKYTYGTGIRSFADASKNGYTFDGWYSDALFTTKVTHIPVSQIGKVVLYAKFTPDTYRINYVLNNGINAAENPSMYTYGTGVKAFADAGRTGYTFDGWYSDASCTAKVIGISNTMVGEVTLYAKFASAVYEIAYETDGGTNDVDNPASYTYGIGVKSFADAVKTGYTFDGWYSDVNFTRKVTDISEVQTGKITLYAKFTPETYPITYVLNNGTNAAANPASYTYGTGVKSFTDAERKGCHFNGWYADASFQTRVSSISETETGEMTLYAKFTGTTYTITYELNGGTNGAGNPEGYTFGTGLENLAPAEKNGYTFDGWYTDAECTVRITSIPETLTENITLYAKFTQNTYHINYMLDGGTNAEENPTEYIYGEGVVALAAATKDGYTFEGWYTDAEFTVKITSISDTQTENLTLYAKFTLNPTPTPIPTVTPTATPTVTPTATPTEAPTVTPTAIPMTDANKDGGLIIPAAVLSTVFILFAAALLFFKKRKENEKEKKNEKQNGAN